MPESRRDPDALLAKVQREEAQRRRGKLKIFFGAAVRLDDADDHVHALAALLVRRGEHGVGLADAGRRAEENLQVPAPAL